MSVDLPTPEDPTSATVCPASNHGLTDASEPSESVQFAVTTGTSFEALWAAAMYGCGSPQTSTLLKMMTGSTRASYATAKYRSSRDGLKSALHEVTTNSVSTFAAID